MGEITFACDPSTPTTTGNVNNKVLLGLPSVHYPILAVYQPNAAVTFTPNFTPSAIHLARSDT